MNISIKLLENDTQIRKKILDQIVIVLNKAINRSIPKIVMEIKDLVRSSLKQEPEYQSLISGQLRAEMGIEFVENVDVVIDALVETLALEKTPLAVGRYGIKGGFSLTMMQSDNLGGVVDIDAAYVVDNARGYDLPWLRWLLLEGKRVIIKGYSVQMRPSPYSRSGMALMIESKKNWRVPPEFSGSQRNNWTTRAISRISDKNIIRIIETNVQAAIT